MLNGSSQLIWLLILTVSGLVQAIILILKITQERTNKKKNPHNPSPPIDYHNHEGRISSLETGMGNIKESNERDHGLIRSDILKLYTLFNRKVFSVLNGMRK